MSYNIRFSWEKLESNRVELVCQVITVINNGCAFPAKWPPFFIVSVSSRLADLTIILLQPVVNAILRPNLFYLSPVWNAGNQNL